MIQDTCPIIKNIFQEFTTAKSFCCQQFMSWLTYLKAIQDKNSNINTVITVFLLVLEQAAFFYWWFLADLTDILLEVFCGPASYSGFFSCWPSRRISFDTGSIEWISEQKGFGFITPDNGEGDLYVPISEIKGLQQGQKVRYYVIDERQARCVSPFWPDQIRKLPTFCLALFFFRTIQHYSVFKDQLPNIAVFQNKLALFCIFTIKWCLILRMLFS